MMMTWTRKVAVKVIRSGQIFFIYFEESIGFANALSVEYEREELRKFPQFWVWKHERMELSITEDCG